MITRMYIIFIKHDNVFLIAQQIADILIGKFYDNSVGKESICNAGDPGWIPGLGRCTGERIGHPLQYSGLENFMDFIVHGVAKSWT